MVDENLAGAVPPKFYGSTKIARSTKLLVFGSPQGGGLMVNLAGMHLPSRFANGGSDT
jgi:hypothetical protein